jgi:IS30 family transposase
MSTQRELHQLVDEMLGDDGRRALVAYRRITDDHLPWLERRAVLAARRHGDSWAIIGRLLGRSRQALQQRFDRQFTVDELRPVPRRLSAGEAQEQRVLRILRDRERRDGADDDDVVAW